MNGEHIQNMPYRIAVTYGSDAETTTVDLTLMTFDRGKLDGGRKLTISSPAVDVFIHMIELTIAGIATRDRVTLSGDLADMSIQRKDDWIIFNAPIKGARPLAVLMSVTDTRTMIDDLNAAQYRINMFFDDVTLIESGDTPKPEVDFIKAGEPMTEATVLARVAANLLNGKISGATDIR
jgi:hypothetical protein